MKTKGKAIWNGETWNMHLISYYCDVTEFDDAPDLPEIPWFDKSKRNSK